MPRTYDITLEDFTDLKRASDVSDGDAIEKYAVTADGTADGAAEARKPPQNGDDNLGEAEPTQSVVTAAQVFRFASWKEKLLMLVGTLMAAAHGASRPILMIFFGNMSDMFIGNARFDQFLDSIMVNLTAIFPNITKEYIVDNQEGFMDMLREANATELMSLLENVLIGDLLGRMQDYSINYVVVGCAVLVAGYLQVVCWQTAAYNQCERIRNLLFGSILRQEIGWFDTHESGELNTRIADDVDQIESGIGEKLSNFCQLMSTFVAGFVVAFVYGWQLALVILAMVPLLAVVGVVANRMTTSWTNRELKAYARAGAVAEEVLGAIRTVIAFGGQNKECDRYSANLTAARDMGFMKGTINSCGGALAYMVLFSSYALGFWYGSTLVTNGTLTAGNLLTVFFAIMMGAFSVGNAIPNLQDFANARGAAYAVYEIIDLIPRIDSTSSAGEKPEVIKGNIEFKDVVFNYPSRSKMKILDGLNLKVNVGQTVALVGASGCGKSTTIQLLQRFYDPQQGQVLVDGTDIRRLNVQWLRRQIGVVSQEPVLFGTSIADNIAYGLEGASRSQVIEAAKQANANSFICKLPKQYDTVIGERGTQLSGGQKQRIAIARALVRDPKILLLDEATSALDTESEASVQEALDKARMGRTTIVIAHRLSTVKTADVIAGFSEGVVIEQGSHDQLMQSPGGVYYQLVTNQTDKAKENDAESEEEDDIANGVAPPGVKRLNSKVARTVSNASSIDVTRAAAQTLEPEEPQLKRIMRLNSPEWTNIVIGCMAALVAGGVQPASAVLYTEIIGVFGEIDDEQMRKQSTTLALLYLAIGAVAASSTFIMNYNFSRSGEHLTMRLRQMAFRSMLKQDIAFFDDLSNSTGALCTRLASDASLVKGATGARLATALMSVASLGVGLGIGFAFSWKLTLLVLAFIPFIMLASITSIRNIKGGGNRDGRTNPLEESGKVAIEAIENMRTVAALGRESSFHTLYCRLIEDPYVRKRRKTRISGIGQALSYSIIFFCYAACFTLGAYLIDNNDLEFQNMFRVIAAVIFGAQGAGQASSFSSDFGKAKEAAARLFHLFDQEPSIDSSSDKGAKQEALSGAVELCDVHFRYPTRPMIPVLRGTSLEVKPGMTLALVGASGCGKSTVVQLLERFYDPRRGVVKVDGNDLRDYNVQWLRSNVGIVSQEPVLFDCSVRDNIAYGDNSRQLHMAQIIEAARQANIHSFIETLPQGYDTNVGDKGTQLSGGQKQRVAIARALVRNPKLLLLDEATSALDTESEKVVQEALDRAQEGRTSVVIAHRLSTIQNADCIVVIHNGQVVEIGSHAHLLQLRKHYYNLYNVQSKRK